MFSEFKAMPQVKDELYFHDCMESFLDYFEGGYVKGNAFWSFRKGIH